MRPWNKLALLSSAAAIATSLNAFDARAVVVQVNGQVVPTSPGNLQTGLNRGENGCPVPSDLTTCYVNGATPPTNNGPGPNGAIPPIEAAGLDPQIFTIPRNTNNTFKKVDFVFLWRGSAGFQNSFGWYNVGDDLSDLNNLHMVISCNPWVDPNVTPTSISVDFQVESQKTTYKYKGGAIGFFLVTPEGGGCGGCGRTDDAACVGRLYYTERELNGDGNYVHYLVYQSKVRDAANVRVNDYYFGFEDLYRGGDNDFKDVTMLVKGLVVPCVPGPELCDGKDNNCDGIVDNNTTDSGGACAQIAGNKPGVGQCKAGTLQCLSNTLSCIGEIGPQPEACNGKDDDCDGTSDNPANDAFMPALPNTCGVLSGQCKASTKCVSGLPICVTSIGPQPETCNGVDDDCNAQIDDKPGDVGLPCTPTPASPTIGECRAGKSACVAQTPNDPKTDALVCQGYIGVSPELCDGKDNDCNGQTDDNPTDLSASCTPAGVKVCAVGHEICVNGSKACVGFTYPSPEICNGKDDDCNGTIDDNLIDTGSPCGSSVGQCKPGLTECVPATAGDLSTDKIVCVGGTGASAEQCDGLDNNCNGQVDENPESLDGVGVGCSTACGTGQTVCKNGGIQCASAGGGGAEVCNGKDDDCNGVIDDNPIDAGGQCGSIVVSTSVKQDPACALGKYTCEPLKPNDPTTDTLQCVGENAGTTETCNSIDDNCNGIVDENTPDDGQDCAPAGQTLPLKGECKPGKLSCQEGKMTCIGGIAPQPEVCDGKDHNCDGKIDENAPCPGQTKCIAGQCSKSCLGEFTDCPGGQGCKNGYCTIIQCSPACSQGSTCDTSTGNCLNADGGIAGSGGSGAKDSGVSDAQQGDSSKAGSGGSGGAAGGAGSSGTAGKAGAGLADASTANDNYGLATGGGGLMCSSNPGQKTSVWTAAILSLLGLIAGRRRRTSGRRDHEVQS